MKNADLVTVAESDRPQVFNASTSTSPASSEPLLDGNSLPPHRDERQIMLDTDRSFVHYPSGEASYHPSIRTRWNAHTGSLSIIGESDAAKEEMKAKLNELIVSVFRKRPVLNYYQVRILLF